MSSGCPHVAKNDWWKTTTCQKTLYLNESDRVTHFCLGWWGKLRCRYFLQIDTSLEWCFLMTQTSSTQADSTCRLAGFSPKFYFLCKWQYFRAKITTLMVSTCGVSLSTMNCHLLTSHTTVSVIDDKNLYTAAHFYKQNWSIFQSIVGLEPVSLVKKWVRLRWFGRVKLRLM